MQLSEFLAVLQKVNQIAGDVPIVVNTAESIAEGELAALHVTIPVGHQAPVKVALAKAEAPPESPQEGAGDPPPPPAA